MKIFTIVLFCFLIVCAIAASFSKNLLNSILIYMSFSLIMSMVWITLQAPDLAITEAAVGAGVTTLLFFGCFKKIGAITKEELLPSEEPVNNRDIPSPSKNLTGDVKTFKNNEADNEQTQR